jgi:methionyl aminopeptidase
MIERKSKEEIAMMREAGRKLSECLAVVVALVKPGVKLHELDSVAEREILNRGATPSFKGYRQRESDTPFPASLCASVNSEVVHGPASRDIVLFEGDIVGLDLGLSYNGWNADMALTIPVGAVSGDAQRLIAVTREALTAGIASVRPGGKLIEVSSAMYRYITEHGFGVVTGFCGHGIGRRIHEEPMVPNYPTPAAETIELKVGMTLAIEPMVTAGNPSLVIADDGWTARTRDGSLSAHFEHTVAVTDNGCEVLTQL